VEERYATELIAGRPHGVGYLLKDRVADVAEFLDALRRVAEGGSALDPRWSRSCWPAAAAARRPDPARAGRPHAHGRGRSNSAIAATLVVGGGAVEKHINNIFASLAWPPPTATTAGSSPSFAT